MSVITRGRESVEISREIQDLVLESSIERGICQVFIQHTSASLMLCENADPTVRMDLERFMSRLAPDGDSIFEHVDEGPDDMPAHVRSILTSSTLSLPIRNGRCALGTWQGIYLWEHRLQPHSRKLVVTIIGDQQ